MRSMTDMVRHEALYAREFSLSLWSFGDNFPWVSKEWYKFYQEFAEVMKMAGKAKAANKTWNGFVACELTAEDKAAFKVWDVDFADAWELLIGRVTEGYRLSFSHNKKNDSFIVSLTGGEGTGANEGYTLSAFGKTVDVALRVLAYKDAFILEGVWENAKVQPQDDIG